MSSSPLPLASCFLALSALLGGCTATDLRAATPPAPTSCPAAVVRTQEDAARHRNCTVIAGDLRITNSQLRDLRGFEKLQRVTGALVIENNPALRNVDALAQLQEVGRLDILNNPGLVSLKGLDGLRRAKTVRVRNNRVVYGRMGLFGALEEVEGLEIHQSAGLTATDVSNLRSRLSPPRASGKLPPRG